MTSTAPPTWPAPELPERPAGLGPPAPTGPDAWKPWSAPLALVAGYVAANIGAVVVLVIAIAIDGNLDAENLPPGALLGATFLQNVAFVAAAYVGARIAGPVVAEHFGLRPAPFWRSVGLVVALYLAFALFVVIWEQLVGAPEDDAPLLDDLGVDRSALLLVLGMLTVCVAAPLVEELFFRGFFYRALRNWAGIGLAAILTGVVFGLLHAFSSPVEHLVPLAVLGAAFCLLYQWTGSLLPCIALHAINNSLAFAYSQEWEPWQYGLLVMGALTLCLAIALAVSRRWRARPVA